VNLWAVQSAKAAHQAQRAHTLHWLSHLGLPGLFAVSIFDASPIPLPIPGTTDLLLLWLVSHRGNPWLLVASAVAGSMIGGYLCYRAGRSGGEAAMRRVPKRFINPMRRWAEGNPFMAVFLPAVLPPPVPLSPFVLAAGALKVPVKRFLIAFAAARMIRYGLVALLGVKFGRHVIRLWSNTLDQWSAPLLIAFTALTAGAIVFAIVRARRRPKSVPKTHPVRESAAD
jgi:membrane protein DedA with SNARE-associated domain